MDEWSLDAEQLPVVFPGEREATPVDAGIVEPVIVLQALGCKTLASCQGHEPGGVAYVLLAEGHAFPGSVMASLQARGVAYDLRRFEDGRHGLFPALAQPSAPLAEGLRLWAREQAAVLGAGPGSGGRSVEGLVG